MKSIKEYLNENFFGNLGIGKKAQIEEWLKKYNITNYTINPDFTINVDDNVTLKSYPDEELPKYIQFNETYDFNIISGVLQTLKGCPIKVKGTFYCECPNLINLEYSPKKIRRDYMLYNCKNIKSLKGCPNTIPYQFKINKCHGLTSLEGAPKNVCAMRINECDNLSSLKGMPKIKGGSISIDYCNSLKEFDIQLPDLLGQFSCIGCENLTSLKGAPKKCNSIYFDDCKSLENLDGIPEKVYYTIRFNYCDNIKDVSALLNISFNGVIGCEGLKNNLYKQLQEKYGISVRKTVI